MPIGNATEPPRTSLRGHSPRLDADQPSNQAIGEFDSDLDNIPGKIRVLDEMIWKELN
ncbi:MAG: hypothetical protein NT087_10160 [Deltaproteobacteria bacterium]|nr:hypothetical protein [Deltaproteobacteria bacterium]